MSTTAKILTILMLLVSLLFVFLALSTTARINSQHDTAVSLTDTIGKQGNAMSALQGAVASAKESIAALRGKRDALTADLSATRIEKEGVENRLADAEREKTRLGEDINSAKTVITNLEDQDKANKAQIANLTDSQTQLQTKLAGETQRAGRLESEMATTKAHLAVTRQKLIEASAIPQKDKEAPPPRVAKRRTTAPVAVDGHVALHTNGVSVVSFKGGVSVNNGDTFCATRDEKVVGNITLKDVYRTIVVSETSVQRTDEQIAAGDKITLAK